MYVPLIPECMKTVTLKILAEDIKPKDFEVTIEFDI